MSVCGGWAPKRARGGGAVGVEGRQHATLRDCSTVVPMWRCMSIALVAGAYKQYIIRGDYK